MSDIQKSRSLARPKLVRDKIPDIIKESGRQYRCYKASPDEYKIRLYDKLREELNEFIERPCYEEAADIYEVFSAMCDLHGLNMLQVELAAIDTRKERGGFKEKIVLESVDSA